MSTIALSSNPLLELWRRLRLRIRFKFVLPRVRTGVLEGIKLDISALSPFMKNIILTGRYESQERRLTAHAMTKDDVVLELGGAIGFIGLYCLKVLGVKHVTSVEANPHTLQQLRRNYELNGMKPHVIHAAAAAEDGELDLNIGGEFWENTVTATSGKTLRVPVRSLRSLVQMMHQPPTTLVCDIEGAEVYLNFHELPDCMTKIIIELHPASVGNSAIGEVLAKLAACGFQKRGQLDDVYFFCR
ncbi:FkbM family methyltransferase [soil metagenome]